MTESVIDSLHISVEMQETLSLEKLLELAYWQRILRHLQASLDPDLLQKIHFQLVFSDASRRVQAVPGYQTVCLISDEGQAIRPELYDGTTIVFQAYYCAARFGSLYNKIFPFPIGCNGRLNLENPVPFAEREINVFFSGNLHQGRRRMFNHFSRLRHLPFAVQHRLQARFGLKFDKKYPASYLRFTSGFMQGLSSAEYADYIKNAKIVLAPHGSLAAECFRHYEALKCGCIVISERLPDNHFLSNSPIIQVDSWAEGDRLIRALLDDPARMEELHQAALDWQQRVLSEAAVAAYMQQILARELLI